MSRLNREIFTGFNLNGPYLKIDKQPREISVFDHGVTSSFTVEASTYFLKVDESDTGYNDSYTIQQAEVLNFNPKFAVPPEIEPTQVYPPPVGNTQEEPQTRYGFYIKSDSPLSLNDIQTRNNTQDTTIFQGGTTDDRVEVEVSKPDTYDICVIWTTEEYPSYTEETYPDEGDLTETTPSTENQETVTNSGSTDPNAAATSDRLIKITTVVLEGNYEIQEDIYGKYVYDPVTYRRYYIESLAGSELGWCDDENNPGSCGPSNGKYVNSFNIFAIETDAVSPEEIDNFNPGDITYQWYEFDTENGGIKLNDTMEDISGSNTKTLSISNIQSPNDHYRKFYCVLNYDPSEDTGKLVNPEITTLISELYVRPIIVIDDQPDDIVTYTNTSNNTVPGLDFVGANTFEFDSRLSDTRYPWDNLTRTLTYQWISYDSKNSFNPYNNFEILYDRPRQSPFNTPINLNFDTSLNVETVVERIKIVEFNENASDSESVVVGIPTEAVTVDVTLSGGNGGKGGDEGYSENGGPGGLGAYGQFTFSAEEIKKINNATNNLPLSQSFAIYESNKNQREFVVLHPDNDAIGGTSLRNGFVIDSNLFGSDIIVYRYNQETNFQYEDPNQVAPTPDAVPTPLSIDLIPTDVYDIVPPSQYSKGSGNSIVFNNSFPALNAGDVIKITRKHSYNIGKLREYKIFGGGSGNDGETLSNLEIRAKGGVGDGNFTSESESPLNPILTGAINEITHGGLGGHPGPSGVSGGGGGGGGASSIWSVDDEKWIVIAGGGAGGGGASYGASGTTYGTANGKDFIELTDKNETSITQQATVLNFNPKFAVGNPNNVQYGFYIQTDNATDISTNPNNKIERINGNSVVGQQVKVVVIWDGILRINGTKIIKKDTTLNEIYVEDGSTIRYYLSTFRGTELGWCINENDGSSCTRNNTGKYVNSFDIFRQDIGSNKELIRGVVGSNGQDKTVGDGGGGGGAGGGAIISSEGGTAGADSIDSDTVNVTFYVAGDSGISEETYIELRKNVLDGFNDPTKAVSDTPPSGVDYIVTRKFTKSDLDKAITITLEPGTTYDIVSNLPDDSSRTSDGLKVLSLREVGYDVNQNGDFTNFTLRCGSGSFDFLSRTVELVNGDVLGKSIIRYTTPQQRLNSISAFAGEGGSSEYDGEYLTRTDNNTQSNRSPSGFVDVKITTNQPFDDLSATTIESAIVRQLSRTGSQTDELKIKTNAALSKRYRCLITCNGGLITNTEPNLQVKYTDFVDFVSLDQSNEFITVESISSDGFAYIHGFNLNNSDIKFTNTLGTDKVVDYHVFYSNQDMPVDIKLYGGKGQDFGQFSGGEGGFSYLRLEMKANTEYVIAGLNDTVNTPYLFKKSQLLACVGSGGNAGPNGNGGAGGGVFVDGQSGRGASNSPGTGASKITTELPTNGILGSASLLSPQSGDTKAIGQNSGIISRCSKGDFYSNQDPCSDVGNTKFRLFNGTEITNSNSLIRRGFKAGYNAFVTAGAGYTENGVINVSKGGNGAIGGNGGGSGGGGGGTGFIVPDSFDEIFLRSEEGNGTSLGGNAGSARVVISKAEIPSFLTRATGEASLKTFRDVLDDPTTSIENPDVLEADEFIPLDPILNAPPAPTIRQDIFTIDSIDVLFADGSETNISYPIRDGLLQIREKDSIRVNVSSEFVPSEVEFYWKLYYRTTAGLNDSDFNAVTGSFFTQFAAAIPGVDLDPTSATKCLGSFIIDPKEDVITDFINGSHKFDFKIFSNQTYTNDALMVGSQPDCIEILDSSRTRPTLEIVSLTPDGSRGAVFNSINEGETLTLTVDTRNIPESVNGVQQYLKWELIGPDPANDFDINVSTTLVRSNYEVVNTYKPSPNNYATFDDVPMFIGDLVPLSDGNLGQTTFTIFATENFTTETDKTYYLEVSYKENLTPGIPDPLGSGWELLEDTDGNQILPVYDASQSDETILTTRSRRSLILNDTSKTPTATFDTPLGQIEENDRDSGTNDLLTRGDTKTINISTTYRRSATNANDYTPPDGHKIYWKIFAGNSASTTEATVNDFRETSGVITNLDNPNGYETTVGGEVGGIGSFEINTVEDFNTEGDETFTIKLFREADYTVELDSDTFTLKDTSENPDVIFASISSTDETGDIIKNPGSGNVAFLKESYNYTFTITTDHIHPGNQVFWKIFEADGVTPATTNDFGAVEGYSSILENTTYPTGQATIDFYVEADNAYDDTYDNDGLDYTIKLYYHRKFSLNTNLGLEWSQRYIKNYDSFGGYSNVTVIQIPYTVGDSDLVVDWNGDILVSGVDYIATDGDNIILLNQLGVNDEVFITCNFRSTVDKNYDFFVLDTSPPRATVELINGITVNEGQTFEVNVTTHNLQAGETLEWYVLKGTTTTNADFGTAGGNNITSGNTSPIVIDPADIHGLRGNCTISVPITEDFLTEGNSDTFGFSIYYRGTAYGRSYGPLLLDHTTDISNGRPSRSAIIQDTSRTPTAVFDVTNTLYINEGSSATLDVTTQFIRSDGNTGGSDNKVYWKIFAVNSSSGSVSDDFVNVSGSVVVSNPSGYTTDSDTDVDGTCTITIEATADSLTEVGLPPTDETAVGEEEFIIYLYRYSNFTGLFDTRLIRINDTSRTKPTITFANSNTLYLDEDPGFESATFRVNTTDIEAGQSLGWTIINTTTSSSDFVATSGTSPVNILPAPNPADTNGYADITIEAVVDGTGEGEETFSILVYYEGTSYGVGYFADTDLAITKAGVIKADSKVEIIDPFSGRSQGIRQGVPGGYNLNIRGTDLPSTQPIYWKIVNSSDGTLTSVFEFSEVEGVAYADVNTNTSNIRTGTVNILPLSDAGRDGDRTFRIEFYREKYGSLYSSDTFTVLDTTPLTVDAGVQLLGSTNEYANDTSKTGGTQTFKIPTKDIPHWTAIDWEVVHVTTNSNDFLVSSGTSNVRIDGQVNYYVKDFMERYWNYDRYGSITISVQFSPDLLYESTETYQLRLKYANSSNSTNYNRSLVYGVSYDNATLMGPTGESSAVYFITSPTFEIVDKTPSAIFTSAPTEVNEGSSITFKFTTTNLASDHARVYYDIKPANSGALSSADLDVNPNSSLISGNRRYGAATRTGANTYEFTVTGVKDYETEGDESFNIYLKYDYDSDNRNKFFNDTGTNTTISHTFTVKDTYDEPKAYVSVMPAPFIYSYLGSINVDRNYFVNSIQEVGSDENPYKFLIVILITDTDGLDQLNPNLSGTSYVYWRIESAGSDFSPTEGSAILKSSSDLFVTSEVTVTKDQITEGQESYTIKLYQDSDYNIPFTNAESEITINVTDNSQARSASFTSTPSSIDEGSAGTFTLSHENFVDGELIYFYANRNFDNSQTLIATKTVGTDGTNAYDSSSDRVKGSMNVTYTPTADNTTEGNQSWKLVAKRGTGTLLANSSGFTVRDTSLSAPYYEFTSVPSSLNETGASDTVYFYAYNLSISPTSEYKFNMRVLNSNGTTQSGNLGLQIWNGNSGVYSQDITLTYDKLLSDGTPRHVGDFLIKAVEDKKTEGNKDYYLQARSGTTSLKTSSTITVIDDSLTPYQWYPNYDVGVQYTNGYTFDTKASIWSATGKGSSDTNRLALTEGYWWVFRFNTGNPGEVIYPRITSNTLTAGEDYFMEATFTTSTTANSTGNYDAVIYLYIYSDNIEEDRTESGILEVFDSSNTKRAESIYFEVTDTSSAPSNPRFGKTWFLFYGDGNRDINLNDIPAEELPFCTISIWSSHPSVGEAGNAGTQEWRVVDNSEGKLRYGASYYGRGGSHWMWCCDNVPLEDWFDWFDAGPNNPYNGVIPVKLYGRGNENPTMRSWKINNKDFHFNDTSFAGASGKTAFSSRNGWQSNGYTEIAYGEVDQTFVNKLQSAFPEYNFSKSERARLGGTLGEYMEEKGSINHVNAYSTVATNGLWGGTYDKYLSDNFTSLNSIVKRGEYCDYYWQFNWYSIRMSKGTTETYLKHANWRAGTPGYWGGEGSSGINVELNTSYTGQPSFGYVNGATRGGDSSVHEYCIFQANAGLGRGGYWVSDPEDFGVSRYYTCRGGNGGNGIGAGGGGGASPSDHAKAAIGSEASYSVPVNWKSWDGHLTSSHQNYYTVWQRLDPGPNLISENGWPKSNGSAGLAGDPHILVKVTNNYSTAGLQKDTTDTAQILDTDSREVVVAIQKGYWKLSSNNHGRKHEYTVAGAFSNGDTLDFGGETWTYSLEDAQQFWLPIQGGTGKINSPTELDYGRRYVRTSKITSKAMTGLKRWTKLNSDGYRIYFYKILRVDAGTAITNSNASFSNPPDTSGGWTADAAVYWGYSDSAVYRIPGTNTGYVKN